VEAFAARSEDHVDPPRSSSEGVRDPDDDYLVDLMRASDAEVLVSLDRDLLDAQLADVTVLDPAKFLTRLADEPQAHQTAND
jgi:predicted nucleic acid-binding protein